MKNLNFLTDLRNSNQVMTRLRPGNNQVKTTLRFIALLTLIFTLGVGNAWGAGTTVTYTLTAKTTVSRSGTAPTGATATVTSTGSWYTSGSDGRKNTDQMTAGKNTVLTLSGFKGYKITGIVLNMCSNSSAGKGTFSAVAGSTTIASISSATTFNKWYDNTSYGTSRRNVTVSLTNSTYEIKKDEDVVITIACVSTNSLYISSWAITYEAAGGGTTPVTGVTVSPTSKSIIPGETFTITPTVAPAGASDKSVSWASTATSYATVNSSGLVTGVAAGSSTVRCTTTDGSFTADCAVTVRGVTLQARDEDGNAIGVGGPGAPTRSGTTITAAANSGNYVFKQWQITNATAASTTTSPTTLSNPTGNVTVTAVYYKPITITYKANGSTFTTQTYARGGTLAFPVSNPDGATYSCTGKTFVGWVGEANKNYSHASTPPTYATAGGSVTAAATYYAVFATASGGGSGSVELSYTSLSLTTGYESGTTKAVSDIDFYCYNIMTGSSGQAGYQKIQFKKSSGPAGYIYNSEAMPGNITSIVLGSTTQNMTVNFGTSSNPDGSTETTTCTSSSLTATPSGNYKYFKIITAVDYASYVGTITINYSSVSYSDYETNCCTPLGSINGSNNLTTSSTGNSVTVSVKTAGVGAYGDANNVSGYDFKLYTASAGGSAAATYSSDSKAGTSHTFTGLTPLTQYWVTVRPIGSGSYCNTTAESDRVAIYTCPGSPNHVDVSGRWDRFGGETISLTAAAYATDGTGTAIPAAKITGYQWQKYYNSQWNNISNAGTTSGATTNNLQITSCSNENSGSYRCVVSTVAGCDIASDGFQVKVYVLECYTGGTTTYNFTRVGDTQAGTAQITLTAGNKEFKVHADNDYYGKNETINEDVTNVVLCNSGDAVCSSNLTIAAGLGGTFTINMEYSTSGSSSVEGEPEISVTYPRKTLYLTPGVWNTGGAKFAFYYYRDAGSSGWTDFITANDCGSSADIPQWNGVKINAVRLSDECSSPDWSDKWNQTSNITITSNNSVSITGWGPDKGDSPCDYGTYAVPTYTISYAKGSTTYTGGNAISGSKADESKTCGVNFTLPAAQFTTTGYVQTGWSKADGGAQYAAVSGTYTDNVAQTFYPVWTANTHTLTWDANGGDALTGDYTTGTVAYGTAITAPNTPTWTGHTFGGWHNGSSVVTPATSMPDNDLTYTAQWSLATYTVTLNTNGGTINAGNVTSYTYGTGATLPTNVTKDGNRFDGWFDNSGCTGDAVTSISSSATGNKEYWAKWTPVRTVTWSVNGSTWSSGVVEGNTHVISGEKVSALPTAPTKSDCDDAKVFVGWRATAIDGTSTSDPGGIFTTQAGSPAIDADKTFYAVFADESGGDNTLVTNVSELTNGTQVYIYAETSDVPAFTAVAKAYASGNNVRATSGSVSNNKLTPGENAGLYTIGEVTVSATKYYTFNDGTYYLRATGTDKNYLVGAAELGDDEKGLFSVSITAGVFSITCKNTSVRGVMQFNKNSDTGDYTKAIFACYASADPSKYSAVQLFKKNPLVYSNYVTSCSSCDADATFTNTTPAVSDIDCTSATLTATGGLATVGADGCHVSDYGFVIGTSDNPAIGGSGVEKLQVGTSDPTIGEDFSYDATGLTKGTRYYIRAYAINRHGTAYSSSTNFWTNNVSSIAITTAPTKTNYIVGETFDATGMVVTATMASGATENVTGDVTYSSSALTAGTSQNFAINYTLCETAKSVNQVINVYTLTVTEGSNPSYGTASGSVNIVSITGLGEHKTYTVTVTSSNATAVDNGDNTWTITNPTGNVAVRVDYAEAAQVKVYYKVDGVTVTGLTQDVYQSETTTLPTASELATAMTAQSMDIPDDDYPNFIGWSETEFPAQTAEPTIVTGTPTINAEKTYYAVYTNLSKKQILPSDFAGSYATNEGAKTIDGLGYNIHDICLQSSKIQFRNTPGYLYSTSALSYIKKIEITGLDLIVNACSDNAGTLDGDAITPTGSDTYVYTFPASKQYFKIKGKGGTDKVSLIEIFYASSTVYYMTEFCATKITLTQNSPEHGTIEFSRSSLATCGSDKNVSLTITPDVGYQLTGWTVNTASGYADAKTTSPAVVTNNNSSAAQNITLTFAQDANKDYDVTATFGLMTVSSWAWTLNSSAIADPLNLYVGQSARLDVTYTPAGVDNSKKTYTRTKEDAYINWIGVAQSTYTTISGRASTGENTTPVTFIHGDGPTTTVNVKVLPLPLVHFGDIVHNVSFDDVVATLSDNTLSPTKTTPTHADFDGATANTCEEEHLHLVGWIREDWPALVTYLNGGAQPSTDDITGAGNDGSGNAYFFAPGASINTLTFNGVTFYAVWAKVE